MLVKTHRLDGGKACRDSEVLGRARWMRLNEQCLDSPGSSMAGSKGERRQEALLSEEFGQEVPELCMSAI